ncbi:unnamed protein product [Cylicocyclus nassatus]|uniref:Uncharacterized protein n=1 Tax=Cylicocyclus nassatus TaxID=53992 RepID=A0AA36GSV0_CYLNA|nr:unnamed protein product [Cylicocyclus nassatus]
MRFGCCRVGRLPQRMQWAFAHQQVIAVHSKMPKLFEGHNDYQSKNRRSSDGHHYFYYFL